MVTISGSCDVSGARDSATLRRGVLHTVQGRSRCYVGPMIEKGTSGSR